jgi:amidophosphoribosyltransferase
MCGIFGICSKNYISNILLIKILTELKHRGSDSYGMSFIQNNTIINIKLKELLIENINYNINTVITHNRYSTTKNKSINNFINQAQPITFKNNNIEFSLVHNGNISNLHKYINYNNNDYSDTQNIMKFFNNITIDTFENKLIEFLNTVHCSYSIIILYNNNLYVIRDRYGYKPLILGQINNNYCVSSENCMKDFGTIRDILPGEILKITENNYTTIYHKQDKLQLKCIFEYIYFMNQNTDFNNHNVYHIRFNLGINLAKNEKFNFIKDDTIVIGSPNTAIPMGKGYASYLNLNYIQLLKKNKTSVRTFILKDQETRINACKKFIVNSELIKNKIIILVDDSLVRGNTINSLSQMFHNAGCAELHIRICSPEIKYPCYYGIDIPTKEELIVNNYTIEEIEKKCNIDSLRYISLETMINTFNNDTNFCTACFTGNHNKELDW